MTSLTTPMQNTSQLHQIDPTMTVKEIAARYPKTVPVFHRYGMDTCCGGGVSVEEAAARDKLDLSEVLAALRTALAE